MTCFAGTYPAVDTGHNPALEELRLASRDLGNGQYQSCISIPGIHCAACIGTVERGLSQVPGVENTRVNLSTKRVTVIWRGEQTPDLLGTLDTLGFPGHPSGAEEAARDPELGRLIRALAVAGFCAMNIMLLSVSVWSGADSQTRLTFHWISAVLALICLVYSGRVFYVPAWSAIKKGRTNMNVPISVGVGMAFGLSIYDTIHNGQHAYFDAATTLLFFLLIGRTLDHLMREKTRSAVRGLASLTPHGATVLHNNGLREHLPVGKIGPGMRIALAAGERVPVDGAVEAGISDLDCSIATGESAPQRVEPGMSVYAGTLNLSGPLTLKVAATAGQSFLARMEQLMEVAEGGRTRYRHLADRAARLYSPIVHATAFLTLLGWMAATGDWHQSITIAIAVLIITCPCALGLAVPIVQVVAARRLFEKRIMVKDGSALERIAGIDTVVFDKTGTLTLGQPHLINRTDLSSNALGIAGALASCSGHPFSRAIVAEAPAANLDLSGVMERPGLGIEGRLNGDLYRLGRAGWAVSGDETSRDGGTVLARDGQVLARFRFEDTLRPGAHETVAALREKGLHIAILSGDQPGAVKNVSQALGITDIATGLLPAEKLERLTALSKDGRKVLMVGDGLNDAPALAAAHASMAPASAADIGRNAADFVFLQESMDAIPLALDISRNANRLIHQNFALAVFYNAIALPVAIAGQVTPLVAALAMSCSSILVVVNALRLGSGRPATQTAEHFTRGNISPGQVPGATG